MKDLIVQKKNIEYQQSTNRVLKKYQQSTNGVPAGFNSSYSPIVVLTFHTVVTVASSWSAALLARSGDKGPKTAYSSQSCCISSLPHNSKAARSRLPWPDFHMRLYYGYCETSLKILKGLETNDTTCKKT